MREAELIIGQYIRDLPKPTNRYSKTYEQRCHALWAANDIFRAVRQHRSVPAAVVVENYADKMNRFSTMHSKTSFMFSVAKDIAEDILDRL